MTRKFASIELARLYETQGYFQDALSMYKRLDDDVLKGGAEIRAAVKRLELALLAQDDEGDPSGELAQIEQTLMELSFEGLEPDVKADEPDDSENLFEFTSDEEFIPGEEFTPDEEFITDDNDPDSEMTSESGIQLPHEKKWPVCWKNG